MDTISRQEAIDAVERKKDKNAKGDIGGFYNKIIQNDIDALMKLPPAEPETIRCKDCKWSYDDISGRICSYGFCTDCVVGDDFYCADAERRAYDEV